MPEAKVAGDAAGDSPAGEDEAATLRVGAAAQSGPAKEIEKTGKDSGAGSVEIDLSDGPASARDTRTADAPKPSGTPVTGPITTGAPHGRREDRPAAAKVSSGEASALETLVQRAMEPMLREWLDKNMQRIVEEVAAKEVRRLSEKS